jgi:hypothetical protein
MATATTKTAPVAMGENVTVEMDGDTMVIRIDTAHRGERSASGKTTRVASTGGNVPVATPNGLVTLGLNAYVK